MSKFKLGDRVRVRTGRIGVPHSTEGYVRVAFPAGTDGFIGEHVCVALRHSRETLQRSDSPAWTEERFAVRYLEHVVGEGTGNLFKVGDVVRPTGVGADWDDGLVVYAFADRYDDDRWVHRVIARHQRRDGVDEPGVSFWNERTVQFVKHTPTSFPVCTAGDRVRLFGHAGVHTVTCVDDRGRLHLADGALPWPSWHVLSVEGRLSATQQKALAEMAEVERLTKLPRAYSCCGCRKSFAEGGMEQVVVSGTWGTCKACFKEMWEVTRQMKRTVRDKKSARLAALYSPPRETIAKAEHTKEAGIDRREDALDLMTEIAVAVGNTDPTSTDYQRLHHALYAKLTPFLRRVEERAADRVRSGRAMDVPAFVEEYGMLLCFMDPTRRIFRHRGEEKISFEQIKPSDASPVRAIQFFRNGVPFGDPHTVFEAAEKVYAFATGGAVNESWCSDDQLRVGTMGLWQVEEEDGVTLWVLAATATDALAIAREQPDAARGGGRVSTVSISQSEHLWYEGDGARCVMRVAAERLGRRGLVAHSEY